MRNKQRSKTAETAAAVRAGHLAFSDPPAVFTDPYAKNLAGPVWGLAGKSRIVYWLNTRVLYPEMGPVWIQILGRARYAEEKLEEAISNGIDQYVLLGAGLDSFALRRRDLTDNVKVFELDAPASQQTKRRRLSKLKLDLPENLEFIPIDFERGSISDALTKSSFSIEHPAFFSWMGTVHYLTRDSVFQTLEAIAAFAKSGSEIVFDYSVPVELADPEDMKCIVRAHIRCHKESVGI